MEKRIFKKEHPLNKTKVTVSNSIFYLPRSSGDNSDPRIVPEDILQGLFKHISIELGVDTDKYDEPASQQDEEMEVDEPNSFQNPVVEEKPISVIASFSSLPSLDPATETGDSFSEDEDESQNFSDDEFQLNSDFHSDNENDCDPKFETTVFLCEMEREDDEPVKKKSALEMLPPLSSIMPQITLTQSPSLSVFNAKVENELNLKTSLPIASVDESGKFGQRFPTNELTLTQGIRSDYGNENLVKLNYDEIPPDEMDAQEKSNTNTTDSSRSVSMFTETEEKFTVGKLGTHERIEVSDYIVKKILANLLDTATLKSMRLVSRKGLLLATKELQKRIVIPLRLTGILVGDSIRSVEYLATAVERSKLFPCNSFQVYTRALHSPRIQYVFDTIGTRIKKLSLILDYKEEYYKKVSFRECTIMDEVKHLLATQTPNLEDFEMKAYLPCHWREGFERWDAHVLEKNASGSFQNFKLHCVFGSANCNDS